IYKRLPRVEVQPQLIRKTVSGPIVDTTPLGQFTALVNTTAAVDVQNHRIEPGAWARVIRSGKLPKILLGHDVSALPVGRALSLAELHPGDYRLPETHKATGWGGLILNGQIDLERELGRDFFAAIKGQFLSEWSVGFRHAPGGYSYERSVRVIT